MKTLNTLFVALATLSTAHAATHVHPSGDAPSTHGMLMFGEEVVFLSHLPMFHSPHDYQVLLKVKLDPAAHLAYAKDRREHPEITVYTLVPETFVLPDMISNPRPFEAQIVRGHFERGGKTIVFSAKVTIQQTIEFVKFDPKSKRPASSSYLLFGTPSETFLAHRVTSKPDFDHILSAKLAPGHVFGPALEAGQALNVTFEGSPDTKPLPAAPKTGAVGGRKAEFSELKELYLEFGDLSF